MIKNRYLIITVGLILLGAFIAVFFLHGKQDGSIAVIYQDGNLLKRVDLTEVTEPYEFTVESENGTNVIRVEKNRISVTDADCPDKICVNTGAIPDNGSVIVCLPHRLEIRLEETEIDAVTG